MSKYLAPGRLYIVNPGHTLRLQASRICTWEFIIRFNINQGLPGSDDMLGPCCILHNKAENTLINGSD